MQKNKLLILLFTIIFITAPFSANAHGGGLAADGCHNDNISGGRHCHNNSNNNKNQKNKNPDLEAVIYVLLAIGIITYYYGQYRTAQNTFVNELPTIVQNTSANEYLAIMQSAFLNKYPTIVQNTFVNESLTIVQNTFVNESSTAVQNFSANKYPAIEMDAEGVAFSLNFK